MAKIKKRNLDSVKRAPVRKQNYQAPSLAKRKKQVPKEYQTLQKAPKGKGSCLWFLFLLFLATAAGFWYWSQQSEQSADNSLRLTVNGPSQIISGDQATYKISYENIDTVTLQKLELAVRWPNGFYYDDASIEPFDENATTWLLEDIGPGRKVELEIKGQLVGQKDQELTSSFSLSYQPENFHSDFKVKDSIETKISDAKIELGIEAIDKVLVATEHEMKVNFTNLTEDPIEDLYIDILYPDDFQIMAKTNEEDEEEAEEETEPQSEFIIEGDYYKVSLEPEETKTMVINGAFTVDSKPEQLLVVEVGNLADENFRRLARAEQNILVVNPKFDMDFNINGNKGAQSVNWSDKLQYQLEVTNNSQSDINDVVVSALIDSQALDWESLDTIGTYNEGKITWTKVENEELAIWPAGESRIFTWQLNIVEEPQPERTVENIIEIKIEGLEDWQQVSSPVLLTIGESLTFNNGVYWDLGGRRVGSGLLPPQVGEETQYLAIWSIPQATGIFDTVSVRTVLPPQVDFISEMDVQGGLLEFDLAERSLTWEMEDFSDAILPLTASFMISVTPEEDNQGQAMTIFNSTELSATGLEEVVVRSKAIKTSDVISDSSGPIGIVE